MVRIRRYHGWPISISPCKPQNYLGYILVTFRLGNFVFRVLPFVPLCEEWRGSNNNVFAVGDQARLEAIDHNKETQNEIVDGCESECGSDQ